MRANPLRRLLSLLLPAALAGGLVGCGGADNGPKVHPLKGKIVLADGTSVDPLAGGKVRLQGAADTNVQGVGTISEGGLFGLATYHEQKTLPGVQPGEYKVRIDPPEEADGKWVRAHIDPKYHEFDRSGLKLTVPGTDEVVLELQPPRQR